MCVWSAGAKSEHPSLKHSQRRLLHVKLQNFCLSSNKGRKKILTFANTQKMLIKETNELHEKKKRLHEVMPPCYTIHYGQAKQDILNVTLDDGKIIYPSRS